MKTFLLVQSENNFITLKAFIYGFIENSEKMHAVFSQLCIVVVVAPFSILCQRIRSDAWLNDITTNETSIFSLASFVYLFPDCFLSLERKTKAEKKQFVCFNSAIAAGSNPIAEIDGAK